MSPRGRSHPLGATLLPEGANFSLYSRAATGVELLLFDREEDERPARAIALDPSANRTYHYWHMFVPGVQAGQIYGYRVHGPYDPNRGFRFDPSKTLLDPYGRAVVVPAQVGVPARAAPRLAARRGFELDSVTSSRIR